MWPGDQLLEESLLCLISDHSGFTRLWGTFSAPDLFLCNLSLIFVGLTIISEYMSQRSGDRSFDLLTWFLVWLTAKRPSVDKCVPIQIISNHFNLFINKILHSSDLIIVGKIIKISLALDCKKTQMHKVKHVWILSPSFWFQARSGRRTVFAGMAARTAPKSSKNQVTLSATSASTPTRSLSSVNSVSERLLWKVLSRHIWKHTLVLRLSSVSSVWSVSPLRAAWKYTCGCTQVSRHNYFTESSSKMLIFFFNRLTLYGGHSNDSRKKISP